MKKEERKELKTGARRVLKGHYLLLVALCLAAAMLSAEFARTLSAAQAQAPAAGQAAAPGWHISLEDAVQSFLPDGAAAPDGPGGLLGTQGVLAGLLNQVASGSILVTLAAAAGSVLGSESAGIMALIVAGALAFLAFWFLVQNLFPVILRRMFLEGRVYRRVPLGRLLYLLRVKKWLHAAWVMLVKYVWLSLWSLTVVGGIVKHYSYYLVPYILAENPTLTARQAVGLSRRMMRGHKWECFVLELSFLGWWILGALTLGLTDLFYTNPYQTAAFCEYYTRLRAQAKVYGVPGAQWLNDEYLFRQPEGQELQAAYGDVLELLRTPPVALEVPGGWKGFLAKWLGVVVFPTRRELEYERDQARRIRLEELAGAAEGQEYPARLFSIREQEKRPLVESLHYVRHYSVWSLLVMFFGFSFAGWLWEVCLVLVTQGVLANRGSLHGPWLPIYGAGAVLILTLLNRLRRRPGLQFAAAVALSGVVEFTTSWVMEQATGLRWWDYSGYFLNLDGRICAEGLLVFGVGGMAVVYVLAPLVDNLVQRMPQTRVRAVCLALLALFAADAVYSQVVPNVGAGITDNMPASGR